LRKGVDFSDPKLPKMTMTTFDGQPYIEQYSLSKLEILPDFGTEHKAAPTPVRFISCVQLDSLMLTLAPLPLTPAYVSMCTLAAETVTHFGRGAPYFGEIPNSRARALAFNSKMKDFIRFAALNTD
jgi:hypothetical protein